MQHVVLRRHLLCINGTFDKNMKIAKLTVGKDVQQFLYEGKYTVLSVCSVRPQHTSHEVEIPGGERDVLQGSRRSGKCSFGVCAGSPRQNTKAQILYEWFYHQHI